MEPIIDIWGGSIVCKPCASCTLRRTEAMRGRMEESAAVGHDCSRSGGSWASGDGLTDACDADRRLAPPPGCGRLAWPPRRTAGNVELRVFPNISNRLAYDRQCFLPVGLSDYLRRHASAFDVAHLHACRNLPGAIAARHLRAAGVPYLLAPTGRRRIWSDAAPQNGCSISSWASES